MKTVPEEILELSENKLDSLSIRRCLQYLYENLKISASDLRDNNRQCDFINSLSCLELFLITPLFFLYSYFIK